CTYHNVHTIVPRATKGIRGKPNVTTSYTVGPMLPADSSAMRPATIIRPADSTSVTFVVHSHAPLTKLYCPLAIPEAVCRTTKIGSPVRTGVPTRVTRASA